METSPGRRDDLVAEIVGRLVRRNSTAAVLFHHAVASLVTGLVQSPGSPRGLFRHYWVVFKLLINVVATVVLLTYMETFRSMAGIAADPNADLAEVRTASPALHAGAALLLLLVATTLSVYKPRGITPYGHRARAKADGRPRLPG